MTRTKTTLGLFTTGTPLWVNVSLMLIDTWKSPQAPRVHIIPCRDQGRTTPGPIYHKCTFIINVSYLPWSAAQSRRSYARCWNINTPSQRGRHSSSWQSLTLKYTNFTLDSWHLSVSLGRCLSPTWTEGKLLLHLSLLANWLSLRSSSLWVHMW